MNPKKKIIVSASFAFAMLVFVAGVTYSWFVDYHYNKTTAYNVQVGAGNVMQVSLDQISYGNSVDVAYNSSLLIVDVTGNGETLYRPTLLQYSDTATDPSCADMDLDGTFAAAVSTKDCEEAQSSSDQSTVDYENAQYISFDLYLRANSSMDVYFGGSTSIDPDSAANKSSYGNFSRNYIAAATRIAVLDEDGELVYCYAPNKNTELKYTVASASADDPSKVYGSVFNWSVDTNGNAESTYYYCACEENQTTGEDEYVKKAWTSQDPFTDELPDVQLDQTIPSDAVCLVTLTKDPNSNYYVGKITVRIWVEGTDREARRALSGGIFNTNIELIAFEHLTQ